MNEFSPHVFRPPLSIPGRLDPAFPVISRGSWVESTSGVIMDSSSPVRSFFGGFYEVFVPLVTNQTAGFAPAHSLPLNSPLFT